MGAEFKVGDHVKVALEGEVTRVLKYGGFGDDCFELRIQMYGSLHPHYVYTDSATIEKVEPPVEVFGPGDVVRSKFLGCVYSLGKEGRLDHSDGSYLRYGYPGPALESWEYTSERFERVEV